MRPQRALVTVFVAIAALVASLSVAPAAHAATGLAANVFAATNAERKDAGLRALFADASLDAAAQEWAEHLAKTCTFEHSTSSWRSSRTSNAGWSATGENIAAGYSTVAGVMDGWMNSAGHKANILDSRYTGLGVGYATGSCGYRTYWVQIFGVAKSGMKAMPSGSVSLSGTATVGSTVTAKASGFASGATLKWQWMSDGAAISGATSATYKPTISDGGRKLTAKVTATVSGYFPGSATSGATSATTGGATTTRVKGSDRYSTSTEVSRSAFSPGVDAVYVASGTAFADALSAAPAAASENGPLLLTPTASIPETTSTELKRLAPKRIVVVGGTGAVSAEAFTALQKIAPTTRIGGSDRYDTSRALVREAFTAAPLVYVATGRDFPDALTAGAAAGAQDAPVLLVDGKGSKADAATLKLLKELGTTKVRIAGGTGAVSSGIQSSIANAGITVERVQGGDRYATAAAINAQVFPSATAAYLSNGMTFADALSAAAAAGAQGTPLYTTPKTCLAKAAETALTKASTDRVTLIGGTGALTAALDSLRRC